MDEQTTPKKVRRVGSIAFALVLIAAGVLLIVYQFVPQFDLLKILKFSPVILIALGIEMLVYSARPDVKVKFDWLAMLGTAFTLCIVGTAALLPLAISEWGPARNYAQTRIESQKADAMYSALTPNPALKAKTDSLSVDVWFNHDTDGDYTLQSGDDCILYAALQGPYADAETPPTVWPLCSGPQTPVSALHATTLAPMRTSPMASATIWTASPPTRQG